MSGGACRAGPEGAGVTWWLRKALDEGWEFRFILSKDPAGCRLAAGRADLGVYGGVKTDIYTQDDLVEALWAALAEAKGKLPPPVERIVVEYPR